MSSPRFTSSHTPEARILRNDSKNPNTTCKGITASERPCRRALAVSPRRPSLTGESSAEYCWQHLDQANVSTAAQPNPLFNLRQRTSIETMADRLHISGNTPSVQSKQRPTKKHTSTYNSQHNSTPSQEKRNKQSFFSSLCCGAAHTDGDYYEIVKHKRRTTQQHAQNAKPELVQYAKPQSGSAAASNHHTRVQSSPRAGNAYPSLAYKSNSPLARDRASATSELLRYIPNTLSPDTTSKLLQELNKTLSSDEEEGYIYMYWITDDEQGAVPKSTTDTLLAPTRTNEVSPGRRKSDVLSHYSFEPSPQAQENVGPKTLRLKIGRANNVHRRLGQWTRQCGQHITLARFYPYVPTSSPAPSPSASPGLQRQYSNTRKVPNVHRVERLIHIELASKQVKEQCKVCGREHREFFEIEASTSGLRHVDGVIKRWIEWGEDQGRGTWASG